MLRPNLAARPFLDSRPVVVTAASLALVALALTAISVSEFVTKRGEESHLAVAVASLEERRNTLASEVSALDRQLAKVPWKKLRTETASLQEVVVQRRLVWSTLFADLERVLPWDVRLTSIDPQTGAEGEVTVAIAGVAADRTAWLKLLSRLLSDPRFSDPIPLSEAAPGESDSVGFTFTLRVRYWPEGRS